MSRLQNRKGPTLPTELLERLQEDGGQALNKKKRGLSRKDARKLERDSKKQRTAQFHSSTKPRLANGPRLGKSASEGATRPTIANDKSKKRSIPPQSSDQPTMKKRKVSFEHGQSSKSVVAPTSPAASTSTPKPITSSLKSPPSSSVLKQSKPSLPKKQDKKVLTIDDLLKPDEKAREEDDKQEIAWLEYQLGLSKKKQGKGKARYGDDFMEDGLDDLLIDVDRILDGSSSRAGPSVDAAPDSAASSSDEEEESDDDELEQEDSDDDQDQEHEQEQEGSDEEGSDDDVSTNEEGSEIQDEPDPEIAPPALSPSDVPASGKYVPPHLRKAATTESAEQIKLRRQVKGLLNRMSEQNIESLLAEFMALYRSNPRNDVSTMITSQIIEGIASHSSLLDSFVVLYAALVASLHKLQGIDFAAHFVETAVSKYEVYLAQAIQASSLGSNSNSNPNSKSMPTTSSDLPSPPANDDPSSEGPGKECTNLTVLISELYNFQVISCVLVYDLIRDLLARELSEVGVEVLLRIVRNSGTQLRTDDPLALKDIVGLVQAKVGDRNPRDMSSRLRFMIETLTNLKNNKVRASAAQSHTQGTDSVTRLRKFISGLGKKHHVMAHEPLAVSLSDLHAADKRGKWWLVGSAWAGDPLAELNAQKNTSTTASHTKRGTSSTTIPTSTVSAEDALLKLARKHGMNTEVRRSIFVVLMSSDDYVDACERLDHLNLNEVQRREIGRVLVHCCSNEKSYNPYYTIIGQHLCRTGANSHSFQVTLQYCLWDFLREIGESEVGGTALVANLDTGDGARFGDDGEDGMKKKGVGDRIRNVAHAYAWWVAKGSLGLSILKGVPFDKLKIQGRAFFDIFFGQLLLGTHTTSPLHSIASSSSVPMNRDRAKIEDIFVKAVAQHESMAVGMYKFLEGCVARWEKDVKKKEMLEFLSWGVDTVRECIREGLDL